ncbi:MAG: hypothetical protein JETT_3341 [Candidatus Jettenia ecosi]|uniref:Uncharacterized protein n=1 Tax=Candidatus Jettenia ecosi TaxID=2494326 RepID=A0A533Q714_9BACT|nr:MAG: hypothetical protein JETT_3341 [Candidatus Jettenia ecosi]
MEIQSKIVKVKLITYYLMTNHANFTKEIQALLDLCKLL